MKLFRVSGVLDLDVIRARKLLFLGLGSLGSLTAGNLPYEWRETVLIDPETLEENNIERHLLGRAELGQPKAEGVRRWFIDRGIDPRTIVSHVGNAQDFLDLHTDADLLIVGVDNRRARDDVNAWAVEYNIPAIYGGIYPRGTGGDVMVISRPREVCGLCAEFRMGNLEYKGKPTDDYGVNIAELLDTRGDLKAVPALRWAISSIAADMADIALDILMKGGEVKPHILVHAHHWEPVLVLRPGRALTTLASFIASLPAMGLLETMKLGKLSDGTYQLLVQRGIVSLRLERWNRCSLHAGSISTEEI